MFNFIYSQLLFYISLVIILFLPGYFLLLAIFGKSENQINKLERFIFSFGLSLIVVDFIAFAFSKLNILITARNSVLGIVVFCLVCFGIYKLKSKKNNNSTLDSRLRGNDLFIFSKNQLALIFIFLFLTILIKTAYLTGTVAPTATDMGHHLYWTKQMTETHKLPDYEGMPDFIIGEHIALGEIAIISGADFFGAFPVVFLFLINILSILTVFILTLRIFKNKNVAILSLLFLGVLFAVSSPQVKFVSGGVIGNILGNFLMPLVFYFYFRAGERIFQNSLPLSKGETPHAIEREAEGVKNSRIFLSLAIFTTFGLFYTHHLTAFIFLFITILFILLYLLLNLKEISEILKKVSKIIFSWPVIITFVIGLIFFFFIFTPNYVQPSAVGTAVGTPIKATRVGLSLNNLKSSVGEARIALGFIGFLLLVLPYKRKNFGFAIIISWTVMLFIMSTKPNWLLIDLPSSRIGNYMSYPLAILSAYGFYRIFRPDFSSLEKLGIKYDSKNILLKNFTLGIFLILFTFTLTGGLLDSAQIFKKSSNLTPLIQTFSASEYLKNNINQEDIVLKDHNYITGDAWIKLFFMQGYKYPQSRGYFKRYEDPTNPREMCTLYMISNPAGTEAKECFAETKTNYLMVNPVYDSSQFKKLKNFDAVYNNGGVAVYYKNN